MAIISAIVPSLRRPGRFDVVVDGRSLALVSIEIIERLGLAPAMALSSAATHAVERDAAVLATYDRALNLLARRARSASELHGQLVKKGEPPDQVAQVIARLIAAGYLSDADFARQFTRTKLLGPGLSRRRVQQELARRGVARDVADAAIDEVAEEEQVNDASSIERVAAKKMKTLAKLHAPTRRRRLYAFLARRGFDGDDILRVMRKLGEAAS